MNRVILWLTLAATIVLLAFSLFDTSISFMWLASTSSGYIAVRTAVLVATMGLLITKPPRNLIFRTVLGVFAAGLGYYCLAATYQNHMNFLDTMTLLPFSIACGLTVLELDEAKLSHVPATGLRRWTASIYAAYTLHGGKLS